MLTDPVQNLAKADDGDHPHVEWVPRADIPDAQMKGGTQPI